MLVEPTSRVNGVSFFGWVASNFDVNGNVSTAKSVLLGSL